MSELAPPAVSPSFPRGRTALPWLVYAVLLLAAPLVFDSSLGLNMLSQGALLVVVCLSYNLLLGQGGMLSFGHAVYVGMGGYLAIHAMNLAARGVVALPLPLVPLVGGLAGLFCSALLGWVSTRRAGTTFAMITLGVGELVFAMALMFPGFFGGEAGITTNRTYGAPIFGWSFGPQIQVYYLIAIYCFVCTGAMFAFTLTPLGRMLNAVRDNPERAAFVGYNPQRVRYGAFMVAGFFAGIGGGLAAINAEIVTSEVVGTVRSGSVLLFVFLGGAGFFWGPVVGAVLMLFALFLLSGLTSAWLLYVGLAFMLMVMFVPGGAASLLHNLYSAVRSGHLRRHWKTWVARGAALLVAAAGATALVEMAYHRQLHAALGPELQFLGLALHTGSMQSWLAAAALCLAGAGALWWMQPFRADQP